MKEEIIKLTPQQNKVINCLQNDWILIADCDSTSVCVGCKKGEFYIGTRLFWNLVDKGLIYQEHRPPWDYILTPLGKKIKTKDIQLEALNLIKK